MFKLRTTVIASLTFLTCLSAHAQSSVTLFGVAEAQVGTWKNLAAAPVSASNPFGAVAASTRTSGMPSYGINASRFGLRGVEELGNGLKAGFTLENQLALDTGTIPARLFHRQSNIWLSGDFGQIKLGRVYSAWNDVASNAAVGYGDSYDPYVRIWHAAGPTPLGSPAANADGQLTGLAGAMGTNNDVGHTENWSHVRVDKSIRYDSPKFFNTVLSAQVGLGNPDKQPSSKSFAAVYDDGKIRAGLGYFSQNTKSTYDIDTEKAVAAKARTGKIETMTLAFNYDFGPAKLVTMAGQSRYDLFSIDKKVSSKEWSAGVIVPYQSWIFKASVAGSDSAQLPGRDIGYAAEAHYNLSKRSAIYGAFTAAKHGELLYGQDNQKSDLSVIGLRHFF